LLIETAAFADGNNSPPSHAAEFIGIRTLNFVD
jgi:hypothetical protein